MNSSRTVEDFGGTAPDHDQAGAVVMRFEILNVLHEGFGQDHLVGTGFDVGAVDALDVFVVEHGFHGLDGRERLLELIENGAL